MAKLIEQKIPTLFGGVSRQPTPVRQHNQLEVVTNALPSVVTGGFEKRPGSQLISKLAFVDADSEYYVHPIDRDETEQTFVLFSNGVIQAVNAITGAEITVNIGDSTRYFLTEQVDLDNTGIVQIDAADMEIPIDFSVSETELDWEWKSSDATTLRFKVEGSADGVAWNDLETGIGGAASGSFTTTIDAVATGDHNFLRVSVTTGAASATSTLTLKATFMDMTYLLGATAEDIRATSVADNTFVVNRQVITKMAEVLTGTVSGTKQSFTNLPNPTGSGAIWRVKGTAVDGFGSYYVIDDTVTNVWTETADPTAHNIFDAGTLPHRLIRESDGTFTFQSAPWDARSAGDEDLAPAPSFIGRVIQDVTFFRGRLALLSDENVITSQTSDVFNLWPEKSVEVLATDPVDRAATTNDINILKAALTFRKILFCTSARAQFELTSLGAFTPESAEFDQATTYTSSPLARPASMGDVLYFGSAAQSNAILYEYYFNDATLSNTASDVTKHILGYIPTDILKIETDATTSTVFVLTTGAQNCVFCYRTFFDGNAKLQSAWGKYTFGDTEDDAFVHGMAVFSGFLVALIERDDGDIYLEQLPIERETQDATMGYTPFLDQREVLTGSYDAGTNKTTWTTAYAHDDDVVVILGPNFDEPGRELRSLEYPTSTTVTAVGDFSTDECYAGRNYTMTVELSKIFPRDSDGTILHGRSQLRDIAMQYVNTGYFRVQVTLPARDTYSVSFEGKVLGSNLLSVGQPSIDPYGAFKVPVHGESLTARIEIINDKPYPSIITSAAALLAFNEISRQE
jgi:hypothetical protein